MSTRAPSPTHFIHFAPTTHRSLPTCSSKKCLPQTKPAVRNTTKITKTIFSM